MDSKQRGASGFALYYIFAPFERSA